MYVCIFVCLCVRRYAAVYRLVHQVLVIVVSAAHANVLSCLNLAASISRLLVAEARSIELTQERILKKYAQVRRGTDQVPACPVFWYD
jgi:hypothetical protein